MSSRSLVILPDDSAQPILDAINGAQKSLRIKMFVFSDPETLKAVVAAQKRGCESAGDAESCPSQR
jgi:cardiolipin synthase A/B